MWSLRTCTPTVALVLLAATVWAGATAHIVLAVLAGVSTLACVCVSLVSGARRACAVIDGASGMLSKHREQDHQRTSLNA